MAPFQAKKGWESPKIIIPISSHPTRCKEFQKNSIKIENN